MAGRDDYDYIVVGGGSGGCVVAGRLAERGLSVLLLEAGPKDASMLLSVPGAGAFGSSDNRFNWHFETEPQPRLDGRKLYLSQGRVLGGGSSINGMVYTRGFRQDWDAWRDVAGCHGWGYDDVLPWFRESETSERGANHWHGGNGPLKVSRGTSSLPICDLILAASDEAGYARTDDFCALEDEGFGYYDFTISRGRRSSASQAFLHERRLPTLTIRTSAPATAIVIEGGRAVGVRYLSGGQERTARAAGEVILAGGAVNTPKLMMLSGIGPADELKRLGIPVRLESPQVGQNLQNHLCFKLAFATRQPITAYRYLSPFNAVPAGLRYLAARKGFLAEGSAPAGGFFKSDDGAPFPDLQLFAPPAVVGLAGQGWRALLPSRHGFTFFVSHGKPKSRGHVGLRSADPAAAPVIEPNYLAEEDDLERLVLGVERLRELAAQPSLAAIVDHELLPGAEIAGRPAIRDAVRRRATNQFHVAGTCRMGSDEGSVTDLELRVRGIEGLRVADASAMPLLMNGNTNAPVMMIGERLAAFLTGRDSIPLPQRS